MPIATFCKLELYLPMLMVFKCFNRGFLIIAYKQGTVAWYNHMLQYSGHILIECIHVMINLPRKDNEAFNIHKTMAYFVLYMNIEQLFSTIATPH